MDAGFFASHIRTIADWPEPGVMFRDITPLLREGQAFGALNQRRRSPGFAGEAVEV